MCVCRLHGRLVMGIVERGLVKVVRLVRARGGSLGQAVQRRGVRGGLRRVELCELPAVGVVRCGDVCERWRSRCRCGGKLDLELKRRRRRLGRCGWREPSVCPRRAVTLQDGHQALRGVGGGHTGGGTSPLRVAGRGQTSPSLPLPRGQD